MTQTPATPIAVEGQISIFAPLRNRVFRTILLANLVASFGTMAQSVGASWLMMSLAPSPDMIALVQTAILLPMMLFSLVTGALADIFSSRRVMLAAQSFMLVVSVILIAMFQLGVITPWLLLAITFLLGSGAALNQPAWQTSIGEQVEPAQLPSAVTLSSISSQAARSVGPAIGGMIVSIGGAALGFLLNALSYLCLIAVLLRWRPSGTGRDLPRERLATAVRSGIQYVMGSPPIRAVLLRAMVFGLSASAIWGLLPLIARDLIGGGPVTYGLLLGAFGLGSVIAGLLSSQLRHRLATETIVRLGSVGFAVSALLVAWTSSLPLAFALMVLAGSAWVTSLSTMNVSIHASTPRWVVGRAFATFQMALFGGLGVGAWGWGVAAAHVGLPLALAASGAVMLGSVALGRWWRIDAVLREPEVAGTASADPEVLIPIDPDRGPVTVMVSYEIPPENVDGFLAAMAVRERIRRRDGARRWILQQDLARPDIWIERFDSPRWGEYLHYRTRMTMADHAAEAHVRSFHRDTQPPAIRRLAAPTSRISSQRRFFQRLVEDPALPPQGVG